MPRSTAKAAPVQQTRVRIIKNTTAAPAESFNLNNALAVSVVGLLVSLVGTGIVSVITLYTHQATLTEQVTQTSATLARHLDHSVDKEAYDKRDKAIQKMLDNTATKEEVQEMRDQLKQELRDLNEILRNLLEARQSPGSAEGHRR